MTSRSRGDPDRFAPDAALVPTVPAGFDHQAWATAQVGARRSAKLCLGAARAVPVVRQDVDHPAELVAAVWVLLSALPGSSLGRGLRQRRRMGTGGASLRGPRAVARPQHAASMGLAQSDQLLVRGNGLDVGPHGVEVFAGARHPRLGLGGSCSTGSTAARLIRGGGATRPACCGARWRVTTARCG